VEWLNEEEIYRRVTIIDVIEEIEAFYLKREVDDKVPERMHLEDRDNTVLIMPSFYADYYGTKVMTVAPNNFKKDKPSLYGLMILNDRDTLEPMAIFDAKTITALRTGAIGGLSMKYLSNPDAKSVGIIGTGVQGWGHFLAACAVRPIEKVYLYNRSKKREQEFIKKVHQLNPTLEIFPVTPEEVVLHSDLIVTATTSTEPVLPKLEGELLAEINGKHITACGSFKPNMQEIPDTLLHSCKTFYIDTLTALKESGDMIQAKSIHKEELNVVTLEELVRDGKELDKWNRGRDFTLFKSVGMAIFDIVTAKLIFEKGINSFK
jgi:ornithine cyclodeaminase/alanine dehydrogenase-like protein (mu-crystallin family)